MKAWTKAEILELDIEKTAYGRNYNAKEANADKHHNNGAGGSLPNQDSQPVAPGDDIDAMS